MNPALGILPIGVFIFLNAKSVDLIPAVLISLSLSLLLDILFHYVLKASVYWLMPVVSFVPLTFTCLFALLSPVKDIHPHNYMIICEIWLVITLVVIYGNRKYITNHYFSKIDVSEKKLLQETFSIVKLGERLFTLHLFIVLGYSFLMRSYGNQGLDFVIYVFMPLFIVVVLIAYGSLMLRKVSTKLLKEEWLPVIDEKGKVIGKVAKSVSQQMRNRFLHPVIRIALVCDGMIYLEKRPDDSTFEPDMLDHPFEKYMLFKHDIGLAARNCISNRLGGEQIPFNFQFKYFFENKDTKRLILFFVSNVKSVDEIKNIDLLKGKFWTVKQIDEEIDSKIFSECFLKEYEYMKNTVLNPIVQQVV